MCCCLITIFLPFGYTKYHNKQKLALAVHLKMIKIMINTSAPTRLRILYHIYGQ